MPCKNKLNNLHWITFCQSPDNRTKWESRPGNNLSKTRPFTKINYLFSPRGHQKTKRCAENERGSMAWKRGGWEKTGDDRLLNKHFSCPSFGWHPWSSPSLTLQTLQRLWSISLSQVYRNKRGKNQRFAHFFLLFSPVFICTPVTTSDERCLDLKISVYRLNHEALGF